MLIIKYFNSWEKKLHFFLDKLNKKGVAFKVMHWVGPLLGAYVADSFWWKIYKTAVGRNKIHVKNGS